MANPVVKIPSPQPDLLAVDVTRLLSGQVDWSTEMVAIAAKWMLSTGLTVILVLCLMALATRAYAAGIDHVFRVINSNLRPDSVPRVTQRTNTLSGILRSLGKAVIYFLGAMVILSKLGINVAPILASAGILGLAVGFGAQSLVKDVISGFFILVEDQYGVGDVVEVNGNSKQGLVERFNLRITQIRMLDGQLITIPNGTITLVVNHSKEWARAVLEVGVSLDHDPEDVIAVLKRVGDELQAEMPDKIVEAVDVLGLEAIKESEMVFKLAIKTVPLEQWSVARAYRKKMIAALREAGITISLPHRKLVVTADAKEALVPAVPDAPRAEK